MRDSAIQDLRPYAGVRALERGLDIMLEIGRRGRCKPGELSIATGLDRTTVYRLLETLRRKGFISQNDSDGRFGLTITVRQLGEGFTELDGVSRIAAEEMNKLTNEILWPSDFASFSQGRMVIQETTHAFSPFSKHRGMVGQSWPLTRCSLGRAALWAAAPEQRQIMLDLTGQSEQPDAADARDRHFIESLIFETGKRGYGWTIDQTEVGMSGIALPVTLRGHVIGAINIIFYTSALTPHEAAVRYLERLKRTVGNIETRTALERPEEILMGSG